MAHNETPVTIEYTYEEHELLNSIMTAAIDSIDTIIYGEIYALPEDSDIRVRYELLNSMRNRSLKLWSQRWTQNS
jgi:hypothetical protein